MGTLSKWAWMQEPDGVLNKLFLAYICHCLEEGYNVSSDQLCDLAEASIEQVLSVLEDLRKDGLISFQGDVGENLDITVNVQLNIRMSKETWMYGNGDGQSG